MWEMDKAMHTLPSNANSNHFTYSSIILCLFNLIKEM